jgi:hypothetical protein
MPFPSIPFSLRGSTVNAIQKQVFESFVRVRAFLEAHPATGALTYRGAQEALYEALDRIWEHASTQGSGLAMGHAELRYQRQLMTRIRNRHMRPIVTIARAQIEPGSDVRASASFRMPKVRLGPTRMLAACDSMMEVARTFEDLLIESGLPSDYLARYQSDRDELQQTLARRAIHIGSHVGARMGLQVELRRARLAVDRLDAIVRVAFEGDEAVISEWRVMKRVHRLPSGAVTGAPIGEEAHETTHEPVPAPQPIAAVPAGLRLAA